MSGAGFVRRFPYFPGTDEITAIEGVVIVDQKSPGPIGGASYGVVAVVGEAADMSHTCKVNSSGLVISSPKPVEVFGGSDLIGKIGTMDSTLGRWGSEMGNLFAEVRNKTFSRLVVAPVDILRDGVTGDQYGIRCWRQLPTNRSATDTRPIVPAVGASIPAGFEFRSGSNRAILAQQVIFTGRPTKTQHVDGVTTVAGLPLATVTVVSALGDFINKGVVVGDLLVPGSLNAAAASQNLLCATAGTLRVVSVDSATQLTVEKLDGTNFVDATDWAAGTGLAYRVHYGSDGDTSGTTALATAGGFTVLARPTVASITVATALTPHPVPTAPSGSYWDVTAGLMGQTHPTGDTTNGLIYDANLHAPNLATTSRLRARYQDALDSLLNDDDPMNVVSVVQVARKDDTIQAAVRLHCKQASQRGMSRTTTVSPPLDTLDKSVILGSTAPGVGGVGGAVRDERVNYSWPGCRTFIPELIGVVINCPDGTTTDDGIVDVTFDTWVACLESKLPPEMNPGQAGEPVPTVFSPVIGYQRGCPTLDMNDYILFKQYGIAALRMDKTVGPIIQSGVTTSLLGGETNINRRRMADYIQDSLAARYNVMAKMLGRQVVKDSLLSETSAFFDDLLSPDNPDAQRIDSYSVDDKSGNTPALQARGIWIIKHKARMLQTLDEIVCQSEVGPDAITVTAT